MRPNKAIAFIIVLLLVIWFAGTQNFSTYSGGTKGGGSMHVAAVYKHDPKSWSLNDP